MILSKLTIQNFLSIRSVELELNNRGMVLICGENKDNPDFQSNGAGKSTIIESLVYVLYGKTIRGLKGDEVVNNTSKRNCRVMLDLVDDDGTEYRVSRYRKHQQQSNKFFLFSNGKDITPKSETDFTKAIVDLLQMDFMTFTSSILYSANSFKFTSATDAELKAAFDTMLGLDLYTACQDEAKAQLRDVEHQSQQVRQQAEQLETQQVQLTEDLTSAQQQMKEYEDTKQVELNEFDEIAQQLGRDKKKLEARVKAQNTTVKQAEDALEDAQAAVDKLVQTLKSVDELQEEIAQSEGLLREYDKDLTRLSSKKNTAESRLDDHQAVIVRLKKKIGKVQEKIDETNETVGTPCPTCGSPLTEESIISVLQELREQISEIQEEIDSYQEQIATQQELITECNTLSLETQKKQKEVEADLEELKNLFKRTSKLREKHQSAVEDVGEAKRVLAEATGEQKQLSTQMGNLTSQLQSNATAREKRANEENPFKRFVEKYAGQLEEIKEKLSGIAEKIEEFKAQIACNQFWVQAYSNSGIKSLLLDDITPYLNRQANKYLRKLSSDHMEIKFSTQSELKSGEKREKFNIEVLNTDGGSSYTANSSGEKKRVDLAVNLALQSLVASRSNKKLNLIMLDEVLDSLDDAGVEHVMDLLVELAQEKSSIFVISHNDSIKSVFTETLTIVKENGYSTLINGTAVEADGD